MVLVYTLDGSMLEPTTAFNSISPLVIRLLDRSFRGNQLYDKIHHTAVVSWLDPRRSKFQKSYAIFLRISSHLLYNVLHRSMNVTATLLQPIT